MFLFLNTNFPLLLLFWVDQSVYLCLQYLCTCRSLDAGHLCRCLIDFECVFVRVCSLYSLSIINNLKIGHFYLLHQVHLDAMLLASPGQCLLQQHHSLIFNSLLNSVSWTFICCVFFFKVNEFLVYLWFSTWWGKKDVFAALLADACRGL